MVNIGLFNGLILIAVELLLVSHVSFVMLVVVSPILVLMPSCDFPSASDVLIYCHTIWRNILYYVTIDDRMSVAETFQRENTILQ